MSKSKNEGSSLSKRKDDQRPVRQYKRPQVLSAEDLEASANICENPGQASDPFGKGGCGIANSGS